MVNNVQMNDLNSNRRTVETDILVSGLVLLYPAHAGTLVFWLRLHLAILLKRNIA